VYLLCLKQVVVVLACGGRLDPGPLTASMPAFALAPYALAGNHTTSWPAHATLRQSDIRAQPLHTCSHHIPTHPPSRKHTQEHMHTCTHTHTHVAHTRMAHTRIWHTRMRTHTRAHTSRQVALGYSCWSSAHRQGTAIPHKQTPYPHLPPFHFLMFEHGIEDAGPHITDGLPINHARAGGTGLRQAANG